MQSLARVMLAVVVVTGPVLSACSSLDSLDPTEWFDTKKKLSGDRKPVFPEGVPGVQSGIPAELVKGYQEPVGGTVDPAKTAAQEAAGTESEPKKQHKSKPKPKPAAADSSDTAQQQPPPAQGGSGWPAPQQQAPWPGGR